MASPSNKDGDGREISGARVKFAPLQEVYESAPSVEPGGSSAVSKKANVRRCTNSGDRNDREQTSDEVGVEKEMCNYSRSGRRRLPSIKLKDYDDLMKKSGNEELKVEEGEGEGRRKSKRSKVEHREVMNLRDDSAGVEELGDGEKANVLRCTNSDDQNDEEHSSDEVGVAKEMCNYSRSGRRLLPSRKLLDYDDVIKQEEFREVEGEGGRKSKKRKIERREVINLEDDSVGGLSPDQETRSNLKRSESKEVISKRKKSKGSAATKREWTRLSIDGDAKIFIGFNCKVYWPADDNWYYGHIVGYDQETDRHHVKYRDGDEEHLVLSNEEISLFVSPKEIQFLGLSSGTECSDNEGINKEVVNLAATLGDSGPLVPGDILWAKVDGHPWWPAIVLDESAGSDIIGLNKISGEKTVLVQFFGTYEVARVRENEITQFLKGTFRDLRSKCKKSDFHRSLEEAKTYIVNEELPEVMLSVRKPNTSNSANVNGDGESSDEGTGVEEIQKKLEDLTNCPLEIGDLQIISLGKIVKVSDCFLDYNYICPEGYTALRKFPSISDPNKCISYKMEVLRDDHALKKPLFRVTSEKGEQFEGPTSSSCWDKIDRKIREMQLSNSDALEAFGRHKMINRSGPEMFGFSHPEVLKLIQHSAPKVPLEPKMESNDLPANYRPVVVTWKDLDKCNVCHMEEEYENNLLLQCDKCRMMVHSRCYGEREPVDGILWYCNLCRPGSPKYPPPCCLCPLIGGAMKPTTDGRWVHLACAIWIPETCLVDVKKMEPVDKLNRIKKDRWKLSCIVCGVSYGACIQCSNSSCHVAYHPLCARAAGFCLEPEGEDRCRFIPREEDEYSQWIRLLSFCKRHKPPSNQRNVVIGQSAHKKMDYIPPPNPSGCARTEPYNYLGRRGIKEPEAHGSVSLKHLYVENRPYLVGGYSQHDSIRNVLFSQRDTSRNIFSMADKYNHMSRTFKKRLAFGKSRIHGFGVFAKEPHRAGDMVIEYIGEVVRAPIADRREYLIYNSFVGGGTYMFRIDNERVIDATKAGSIAHLMNHSCEPNCYSRIITVNGDEHIIIFAKRDIKQWEELTYDYRIFSTDEQLACYCGSPRCRGVLNYIGPYEPIAKQCVPLRDLTVETGMSDWLLQKSSSVGRIVNVAVLDVQGFFHGHDYSALWEGERS